MDETMIDLSGKRALVTGGSRGIGAAIALALAENGADVAFTYANSPDRAEGVRGAIAVKGRRAFAIKADRPTPRRLNGPSRRPSQHLAGWTSSSTAPQWASMA